MNFWKLVLKFLNLSSKIHDQTQETTFTYLQNTYIDRQRLSGISWSWTASAWWCQIWVDSWWFALPVLSESRLVLFSPATYSPRITLYSFSTFFHFYAIQSLYWFSKRIYYNSRKYNNVIASVSEAISNVCMRRLLRHFVPRPLYSGTLWEIFSRTTINRPPPENHKRNSLKCSRFLLISQ